jgi:alkylation response protein AidB-like acyl-CoA dehydrogenase
MCSAGGVDEVETFRAAAREWLTRRAPPVRARLEGARTDRDRFEACRAWQQILSDGGWAALTWPREHGGRGAAPAYAAVFAEEQARFGVTTGFIGSTVGMVGPVLMTHGTDAQRARFLPPLLRADETWCQLFSEPSAGSDLANLGTRAVLDGDEFVVNGQKVWNSNAHLCDYAILLARTNVDLPKHRGITFFLLDMHTPGIDVRPLRQISGAAHFNEVFLTDVRIPRANVLGVVDGGWSPARTVLAHEASVIGGGSATANTAALIALTRMLGRDRDPVVRQALVRAYTAEHVLECIKTRAQASIRAGREPGIDGSALKVLWSEARRERADLGVMLLGAGGALRDEWPLHLLESFSGTIGGGTNEIHRTMLGERVLGLPPEPRVDRDVPYRELRARRG